MVYVLISACWTVGDIWIVHVKITRKGEISPFNFSSRLYLLRKSKKTDSGKEKDPSEEVASFQRNSQSDGGGVVLYAQLW